MEKREKGGFSSCRRIHHLCLKVDTDNETILRTLNMSLGFFPAQEDIVSPDIEFSLISAEEPAHHLYRIPDKAGLVYSSSENDKFPLSMLGLDRLDIYKEEDESSYYADMGEKAFVSFSPLEGRAAGCVYRPDRMNPNILFGTIFMIVFSELLRTKGCYPVHCSVAEKNGNGAVVPGFSGAGKTTSCIALIRKGFGFLGDDRSLLHYNERGELEALAFPEYIDVTDETVSFFPELQNNALFKGEMNLRKKSFCAEDIYPGCIRDRCLPRAVLYPVMGKVEKTSLERISKTEALTDFLPHGMVLIDRENADREFDIISDLILSADCYRLILGHDIENLDEVVSSVL